MKENRLDIVTATTKNPSSYLRKSYWSKLLEMTTQYLGLFLQLLAIILFYEYVRSDFSRLPTQRKRKTNSINFFPLPLVQH